MSDIAIKVEDLSKLYQLGTIGTGTLSRDLKRWWALRRGKEDPFSKVGQINDRTKKAESEFIWALKDINFEVKKGEVLGVIGRNGAGKSTLLKILSKITSPTTGRININGRIASLLEVGTGFHPEMTGRENIFMNGAILGMRKWEIKKKFDEIVEFAGVRTYIDTPVKRYSSGMYVRLAFAVAAFLEPEILIVDEVLAVGDADFQKKCMGRMKDVSQNDGRSILFVSHNMAAIRNLCNKAIILNNGLLKGEGAAAEMVYEYLLIDQTNQITDSWSNLNPRKIDILKVSVASIEQRRTVLFRRDKVCISISICGVNQFAGLATEVFIYDSNEVLLFNCITPIKSNKSEAYVENIIPENILVPGNYKITCGISQSYTNWIIKHESIVSFHLEDNEEKELRSHIPWEGVIKPEIFTKVEYK